MRRSFFDTNVLVYLFHNRDPEKKLGAQSVFAEETSDGRAVFSTQVLQEFYWAVTRKLASPLRLRSLRRSQSRRSRTSPGYRWSACTRG